MTFDFTGEWFQTVVSAAGQTCSTQSPSASAFARAPCAPAYPSANELADLVHELFTEGTLTWDQLQGFAAMAELRPALLPAIAAVSPGRRMK